MKSSPKTSPRIRIAIIGTGGMAQHHARSFHEIADCEVVAAVDVDRQRAVDFAATYGIPEVYASTEELLRESQIDAVSVVTPDPFHAPVCIPCLKAGKHVLCEKPLAVTHPDAKRMLVAAQKAGTIHMVHFSYRNWPCIHAVAKLAQSGRLGEIRHVEASYHQSWLVSRAWGDWHHSPNFLWRLSTAHGSKGVLGDIGVHILDFATYPAGPIRNVQCRLKTFKKAPGNRVGPYRLDANDSAVITVEFANGALGSIQATRWMTGHHNRLFLKIAGTKGSVEIDSTRSVNSYRICSGPDIHTESWREVECKPVPNLLRRFVTAVRSGKPDQPDFARGAEIQKLLDACFVSDEESRIVNLRG